MVNCSGLAVIILLSLRAFDFMFFLVSVWNNEFRDKVDYGLARLNRWMVISFSQKAGNKLADQQFKFSPPWRGA